MVPEAELEQTEAGLVPASEGWFVLNAREARWVRREGRGHSVPLTGWTPYEAETFFPQLGEPIGMYHWEADPEDFLVLAGEALLLVEGEERPLEQWDFVHCPPGTQHMIVGAGEGSCAILAMSAREHQAGDWGAYTVDELALRHGAGVQEETSDAEVAYARFPAPEPMRYREGLLPEL
jgi:mannose-6-phosphate isomerase-like protein (cupin superfamily)